uniref:Transcriptional regulator n=1 Tax=uncultured Thiotrichaceae bacterium TaxID=298394 RepID=A0A6S6UF73_9GAMM|nr:MAG: Transcriptional regulator [uncultured Thiotrichaceae bacterium]
MDINELGSVIRDSRKERQMTQAELSELLGMSRATLSALENGTVSELGIRKVIAICSVLGLELVAQPQIRKRPTLHTLVSEAEQRKRGKG